MRKANQCSECGAELTSGEQGGLCQRCLLTLGLVAATEGQSSLDSRGGTPDEKPVLMDSALVHVGATIGRYKLLEQIGEGGFGVVYMAEQTEPVQRKIALKIIKAGMDTREVIARFEAERQALALMDHPNIAKVFDGGMTGAGARLSPAAASQTAKAHEPSSEHPLVGEAAAAEDSRAPVAVGRPYFVMELVRGIPITEFCDQSHLSTEERLRLFVKVCSAVQHAHQKGIIHRDLKPSNILVTLHDGEPVPKVIDFGVAKALGQKLTDKTLFTGFLRMVGTPAYMSPEQAEMSGLDIDTRADIYALGVLLYELLTGVMPFDAETFRKAALDEVRRMIRETEPPKPSTRLQALGEKLAEVAKHRHTESPKLIHLLRGDLDWIVMKCLEKDRTRRYETANGLAMDVQRHLDNEPVVARPPSAGYRLQKLVQRNKLAFLAGGAVVMALLVGLTISTVALLREKAARERAVSAEREQVQLREQAETEATRSAQVAQFMKDMLTGVGPGVALGRDTKLLEEILDHTAGRLGQDLKNLPAVEAELRFTLGNVYFDLGAYAEAAAMHGKALDIRRDLHGGIHPDTAQSLNNLAEVRYKEGNYAEAEVLHREALALRRMLFGEEHPDVAQSVNNLAESLRMQERFTSAEPLQREALAMRSRLLGNKHLDVAHSLFNLGSILWRLGRYDEGESAHREALAIRRELLGPEHPDVASSLDKLGLLLNSAGRNDEAEKTHHEALAIRKNLLDPEHPDIAHSLQNLAFTLIDQNRPLEAIPLIEQAFAIRVKRLGSSHPETIRSLSTVSDLADNLFRQGRYADAAAAYLQAAVFFRALVVTNPNQPEQRRNLNSALKGAHESLWQQHRHHESIAVVREAIVVLDQALAELPAQRQWFLEEQAHNYRYLGFRLERLEEPASARQAFLTSSDFFRLSMEHGTPKDKAMALGGQADNFRRIGDLWEGEGNRAESRDAYHNALMLCEQIEIERLPQHMTSGWMEGHYTDLAATLRKECPVEMAMRIARVLTIPDKNLAYSGWKGLFNCHYQLGEVLQRNGYTNEAIQQFSRMKELIVEQKKRVGDEHPEVADTIHELANLFHDHGKLAEAEPLYWEALAIRRKHFGNEHARVASSLVGLAFFLTKAPGKTDEAEAVCREALGILRKLPGDNYADTTFALDILAGVLAQKSKRAEAVQVHRELLDLARGRLAPDDPQLVSRLAMSVTTLLALGQFTEAEPLARECLAIREEKLRDDWLTFNARSLLGGALLGQKKFAEAEPLLISGYEGMKQREDKIPLAGKTRPREALERIVQLYTDWDNPVQAAEWKQRLDQLAQASKPD